MALDFLSLIPTVASAYAAYKSSQPTAAERAQTQSLADQRTYQQALADPNSALMKSYASSNRDMLDRDFAASIQTLINQNRRQTLLGRQPLFDPERGDQQILRAQNLGFEQNADRARQMATQTLQGLASGSGSLASGYGNTVGNAQKRQTQQNYLLPNLATAGASIYDALKRQPQQADPGALLSPRVAGGNSTPWSGNFNLAGLQF